ncbi:sodium:proton antiporter, partial [Mycolicibacterium insubricum]|nr:sodium:proton antiporter [Mycolicibacterium insubricum]
IAVQTRQRVAGVVENMVDSPTLKMFGEGGGRQVAESLSRTMGRRRTRSWGQVPLDPGAGAAG